MILDIFSVIGTGFAFGLSVLDNVFDSTGTWPIYIGAIAILMILRFIVLPMLQSNIGMTATENAKKMRGTDTKSSNRKGGNK